MSRRRDIGLLGEHIARGFLDNNGYRVLETNYHCPEGEIDIIAQTRDTLVFVEVRTKSSLAYGTPEESMTPWKCNKLRLAAEHYAQHRENLPEAWRIDFIGVQLDRTGRVTHIEHIENAVEGV